MSNRVGTDYCYKNKKKETVAILKWYYLILTYFWLILACCQHFAAKSRDLVSFHNSYTASYFLIFLAVNYNFNIISISLVCLLCIVHFMLNLKTGVGIVITLQ